MLVVMMPKKKKKNGCQKKLEKTKNEKNHLNANMKMNTR